MVRCGYPRSRLAPLRSVLMCYHFSQLKIVKLSVVVPKAALLAWTVCPLCSHKFPSTSSRPLERRQDHFKTTHTYIEIGVEEVSFPSASEGKLGAGLRQVS